MKEFVAENLRKVRSLPPLHAFSRAEYQRRLDDTKRRMKAAGIDMLIASAPDSMAWLHGLQSRWYRHSASAGWSAHACTIVHVDCEKLIHFDYAGEHDTIRETSVVEDLRLFEGQSWAPTDGQASNELAFIVSSLRADGLLGGKVGQERRSAVPNRLTSEAVERAFSEAGCGVVDASDILRQARRLKSPEEIAAVEQAAKFADIAVLAVEEHLKPGATELEIWGRMVQAASAAGSEPAAIHECVLIGSLDNGHRISSRRIIQQGDYVIIDPCGVYNRYHANISRTYCLGKADADAKRILDVASEGIDVLCDVAKVGTAWADVHVKLRTFFQKAGVWDFRSWIGGYELGLSMPPDWVGDFKFGIEDLRPPGVVEHGLVTNFESNFHFPMLETVIFETSGTRALSKLPRGLKEL